MKKIINCRIFPKVREENVANGRLLIKVGSKLSKLNLVPFQQQKTSDLTLCENHRAYLIKHPIKRCFVYSLNLFAKPN